MRLWPIAAIIGLQWVAAIVPGWLMPGTMFHFFAFFWGPIAAAVLAIGWWMFGTRLSWRDASLVLIVFAGAGGAAFLVGHATFNGMAVLLLALPIVMTAWGLWVLAAPYLRFPTWRTGLIVILIGTWGFFDLVRIDGMTGAFSTNLSFRWSRTAEDEFLSERRRQSSSLAESAVSAGETETLSAGIALQPGDWPAFRGPARDGRLLGVRIRADWNERPVKPVWRHRIGPGWSSFVVIGTRLFTQEQRGEQEVVVCYDAGSGAEIWVHSDEVRFTEIVAGPGPRATPTFDAGRIYALGARGTLNCLDAVTGQLVWTRNMADDAKAKIPEWGFASSPLVSHGLVTVFAGGESGKSVLAYHADTGDEIWSAGEGGHSYCSLQLSTLRGFDLLLLTTDSGLTSYEPVSGKVVWEHRWPLEGGMSRVTQPAVIGDSDILIGTGFDHGLRRIRVSRNGDAWTEETLWTTRSIRPYFNDLVVHGDELYGFDNQFFVCVSLADGKLRWKARGYGNGQVLLLAEQGLLLVLSEQGEVALVEATPESHKPLARFQAIEGKTWNHPVVAHGNLHVRNGEEIACYDVSE